MAYRRTKRVEARLAANRRRILKAARELIAEGGFQQAHIENVAAAAGLAPGTVYRYFPSKTDLMAEVFRTVSHREIEVVEAIVDGPGTAAERVEQLIRTFAARALQRPRMAYAMLAEPVDPRIEEERIIFRELYASIYRRVLEDGMRSGEFVEMEPSVAAACFQGAQVQSLIGPLAPTPRTVEGGTDRIIDEAVRFCLRALNRTPQSSFKEDAELSAHLD